jgi:hypothetical protein
MAITCPQACCAVWKAIIVNDYMNAKGKAPALFVNMSPGMYNNAVYSCNYRCAY